jgi:hypothetical protein
MEKKLNQSFMFWPVAVTLGVLAIPFVGSLITSEVNWSVRDYILGGVVLFAFSTAITAVLRSVRIGRKGVVIALMALLFVLLWTEMAVGIFGSPIAGN